jgi:hypothetical protein
VNYGALFRSALVALLRNKMRSILAKAPERRVLEPPLCTIRSINP